MLPKPMQKRTQKKLPGSNMSGYRDKSQGFGFVFPEREIMFDNAKYRSMEDVDKAKREDVERCCLDFFELLEVGDRDFEVCLEMLIEDLKAIKES